MNTKESMIQSLCPAIRPLLSAAILSLLASVASAAPVIITYGTGSGETSTPYAGGGEIFLSVKTLKSQRAG